MTEPGPVGRRVRRVGRVRRLLRHRPRREPGPGAAPAGRRAAPRSAEQWFPFGLHFIDGLVNTVRRIESTARQREALVALGTLSAGPRARAEQPGIRRDAGGRRAAGHVRPRCRRLAPAGRPAASPPSSSPPSTGCGCGSAAPTPASPGSALADREDELADWLGAHDVDRDWDIAPALAAAGADLAWCEELADAVPATPSPRPWSGSRRRCSMAALARRGQGGHRPRSPPSSPPCGPTRRWTAPRCRSPTSSRAWTARW